MDRAIASGVARRHEGRGTLIEERDSASSGRIDPEQTLLNSKSIPGSRVPLEAANTWYRGRQTMLTLGLSGPIASHRR
jgi:hypothetical protein